MHAHLGDWRRRVHWISRRKPAARDGRDLVGLDSVNQYYDARLKEARLALLQQHRSFEFLRATLADPEAMN